MSKDIDKKRLKDNMGRGLTLSLFYEFAQDKSFAVYSLMDEDRVEGDITYPSLKKLYLESMDPTGYTFAKTHLLGWKHWLKIKANKKLYENHIVDWEDEMEVFVRSDSITSIMAQADNSFPAAKFLSEKGWDKRVGRPTKDDMEREDKIVERIGDEFDEDVQRMSNVLLIK